VLDVACGTGTGLEDLRNLAPHAQVLGLDVSIRMLKCAAVSCRVVQSDAAALPIRDGVVDALVCSFALMHLTSPRTAIDEFARVSRPGATVALTTWGPDAPWPARSAVMRILDDLGAPKVPSSHHGGPETDSAAKLARLLVVAGFEDVTTHSEPLPIESTDAETALRAWSSLGSTRARVAALESSDRDEFFRRARASLAGVTPADLSDPREVIYAWARRTGAPAGIR
jgi:SAM-dependent methyltransferase